MARYSYVIVALCVVVASCGGSSGPRLELSSKERANLDAHVENIFTGIAEKDAAQLSADRQRVHDIHRIAFLAEEFYKQTGAYPLVDTENGTLKNVIIGDDEGLNDYDKEHYVSEQAFLALLRATLGDAVTLPHDPLPNESGRTYVYSVYGRSYATAAMLYHPVGWSEGILQNQFQYRVGARENLDLPILQASKLLAGEYKANRPASYRDPSMAGQ